MAAAEHRFRVMASTAQVVVVDGSATATAAAERTLRRFEAIWSRFISTSDISRLNNAGGRPVRVSVETRTLIATMQAAWRLSGGRYDPTFLPTLMANGYTHSIDDPSMRTALPATARSGGTLGSVTVDPEVNLVTLPPTLALDPGGLGKGVAADLTVARLIADGAAGAMVSIGGDLAADGEPPTTEGWLVAIENPFDSARELCTVSIERGGVATSSTLSRRWNNHGRDHHHLIDPSTGRQSTTDLVAATVVAGTAWEAEAIATGAIVTGSATAIDYLDAHDVHGVVTTTSGETISSAAMAQRSLTATDSR